MTVLTSAGFSVALMLYAGRHQSSRLLLLLFTIWVLSPFVALVIAETLSKRWSVVSRAMLYRLMLILPLASVAIYGADALGHTRAKRAAIFLITPLASWIAIATVVPLAASRSGRLRRRSSGAQ